ncbi:MAG: tail fiber domain-containing protein [Thermodesulfovibrionales bacterium]
MNRKVILISLVAILLCLNGLSWGALIEGSSNTTYGLNTGTAMGAGPLGIGVESDTFIGYSAGAANKTDIGGNTFIGAYAGSKNTQGTSNSFFGTYAGYNNLGDSNNSLLGADNSFFGYQSGYANNTGSANSFFGYYAGHVHTTGNFNTAFGSRAGANNDLGYENVFIGANSGELNRGNFNTFVGRNTGLSSGLPGNQNGSGNSFFGHSAGYSNDSGNYNVSLGYYAGYTNAAGGSSVFIGKYAGFYETNANKLYVDNCVVGLGCSQPLILGDFESRLVQLDGSLTMVSVATPSDVRYKKDIHPLESSLDKVLHLQGVTYEWDKDKVPGAGYKSGRQIGLIAQDVEKILPELVHTDSKGYKTLSYDKLVPVLVEAVKEQQQEMLERDSERKKNMIARQDTVLSAISQGSAELQSLKKTMLTVMGRLTAIESFGKTIASK